MAPRTPPPWDPPGVGAPRGSPPRQSGRKPRLSSALPTASLGTAVQGRRAASRRPAPGHHCKVQAVPGGAQRAITRLHTPSSPSPGGLPGTDKPRLGGERRACRVGITPRQEYPRGCGGCRGYSSPQGPQPRGGTLPQALFAKPSLMGQEGTEKGTHCCGRALPAPPCPWTAPPASAGAEDRFPACPSMLQSPLPSKQPYLHLVFQVLGSGHQGLDLAEREGGKSLQSHANGDTPLSHGWHSPPRGAAPVVSPRVPLRREEGRAIRSAAGAGCVPCPHSTRHGHNSPARRSSSSPRLCW